MSQPNTPDSDALIKQIGIALIRSAPQEWQTVKTEFRAAGRYYELSAEVTATDGTTTAWTASQDIAMMFARLRSTMHTTAGGTWFNARYRVERPAKYNVEFDREEPKWRTPPPIQALRDELRYFPRAEEDVPDWLMMRLSGIPDRSGERRFRIARIFDAQGPGGRPTVNRPPVPEQERERLRAYLDGARLILPVRGNDIDRLSADGRHSVPVAFHSDGTWIWPAAVNYYFARYGLPPEPGLVDHARTQNFTAPELDEQTTTAAAANITGPRPPAPPSPQGPPIRQGANPPASVAELLRQRLDYFGVPAEVYRIGEPAARAWHLSQAGQSWQVGWSTGSDGISNSFSDEHDAAAFLLGKLLLGPPPVPKAPPAVEPEHDGEPEQAAEPARDADSAASAQAGAAEDADEAEPGLSAEPAAQHGGHGAGIAGAALAGGALVGGAVAAGAMSGEHSAQPRQQEAEEPAQDAGVTEQHQEPAQPEPANQEQPLQQDYTAAQPAHQEYEPAEPTPQAHEPAQPGQPDYAAPLEGGQEFAADHGYETPEPGQRDYEGDQEFAAPQPAQPEYGAPQSAQQDYDAPQPIQRDYDEASQSGNGDFDASQSAQQDYAAAQSGRQEYQAPQPGQRDYDDVPQGYDAPRPEQEFAATAQQDYDAARSAHQEYDGAAGQQSAQQDYDSPRPAHEQEYEPAQPVQHGFEAPRPAHEAGQQDYDVAGQAESAHQQYGAAEPARHEFAEPASPAFTSGGSTEDIEASGRHEAIPVSPQEPGYAQQPTELSQHEFAQPTTAAQHEVSVFEPGQHEFESQREFDQPRQHEASAYEGAQDQSRQHEASTFEAPQDQPRHEFDPQHEFEPQRDFEPQQEAPQHEALGHEAPQHQVPQHEVAQHEAAQHEAAQHEAAQHEALQHEALQPEAGPYAPEAQQPAQRIDLSTVSPSEGWKQLRLADDPPGELFRNKQSHVLTPGVELDRYGTDDGSLTYAGGTPFEQCSLPPDWRERELRTYRVVRSVEVLTGNAVPWFEQPGGGVCFLLPAALAELVADGTLEQLG